MITDAFDSFVIEQSDIRGRYGHAAPPGTGPLGETCGTCAHICRRDIKSRSFYKCSIISSKWTHGKKTDILKTDESCAMWEDVTHA